MATIYTIGHSTRTLDETVAALKAHGVARLVDIRAFPMSRRLPHFNRESLEQELPKHGIDYVWMKELGGRRKKTRDDSPNTGLRNDAFRNYADYMLTDEFAGGIERLVRIAEGAPAGSRSEGTAGPSHSLGMTKQKKSSMTKQKEDGMTEEETSGMTEEIESIELGMAEQIESVELGIGEQREGSANTAIMCAERVYFQCHRMLVSDYLAANGHLVLHIDDHKRPVRSHQMMAEARVVDGKVIYNAQQLF